MDIKFPHELAKPSDFSKELLFEFLAQGYATEQLINGETFIKLTSKYFEELGEYIVSHPSELCREYWYRLVDETKNCDIMTFVKRLCYTHVFIRDITDGKVDFCECIGEECDRV